MKKAKIDVPVLLVFFVRPDTFKQVFDQVKIARPSKLFLFQDGARQGNKTDKENIQKCRTILKEIDWDCEVHEFFPDFNYGVDSCVYAAMKWAFSYVDKLVILEDDIVASQSFFKYADELLVKYENDDDIAMIGGMNHLENYDSVDTSYIFAESCAIWGWATWKRFFDEWDRKLSFLNDEDSLNLLKKRMKRRKFEIHLNKGLKVRNKAIKNKNIASFEASSIFASVMGKKSAVVPTKNLITNIGIGADAFHATDSLKKISTAMQKLFFMKRYELSFPLKHPKTKDQNIEYNKRIDKIMYPNKLVLAFRKTDGKIRRTIFK
jgi:hypothetical protein